ncbi:MAG: periplasmic protein TonB [Sphingomonadales bacterium]|jgi:protein TonB|nr:periplasmic protein TonB [Sphingomonadales bacterium]
MMEGAFHQQKRASPTALAVVVLMHGAALTALALAKGEAIREAITRTKIYYVDPVKPPPEELPKPAEKVVSPPETVITHVPPIVKPPEREQFATSDPLPPLQPVRLTPPDPIVVPRADPPAEPKAHKVAPARAKANLASYVSDEDYPSSAVRNEEQGTTRFRLAVGPDGRVTECTVTGSSGSSALDSTTCRLMRQRARFAPAKDSDGRPTSDTALSAIRWVLPD